MSIAIGLGVVAAFLFALAAMFEQRAARHALTPGNKAAAVPAVLARLAPLMKRLLRSRTWLIGWVTNLGGFMTQAAGLHVGSVAIVQPCMSLQVLFALPLASIERRRWPRKRDWVYALGICAGLALFLAVFLSEGPAPLDGEASRPKVILAAFSAVILIAILVLASRRCSTQTASLLISVGAGVSFAMTAVFMKLTTEDLVNNGVAATATDWPGYSLAVSALGGLMLEQVAFTAGTLPWAVAAMSVTNPVASVAVGILAFQVTIPTHPLALGGIGVAVVLVGTGIGGLAHSPMVQMMYGADDEKPTHDRISPDSGSGTGRA